MDFSFTEEQRLIRDTAADFLAECSSSEAVRGAMATDAGFEPALWSQICDELMWHAVHVPESSGGLGLGYVELVAMLEQMGGRLLCAPFFSTVCLGINALLVAGTKSQQEALLPDLLESGKKATLVSGADGATSLNGETITYTESGKAAVLNGSCRYVIDGHTADMLIVAAREKNSSGTECLGLFVVDADLPGVQRQYLPTLDQTRKQAQLSFNKVAVPKANILKDAGNALPHLEAILDLARIGLAAENVGGAQQVLDMTVAYLKERRQFGRAIGGFQALKHKAADMMLHVETARSASYYAACVADDFLNGRQGSASLREAACIAKAYCSDAYFECAAQSLQMHGGIGFTWEHDLHLYFKRAKASQQLFGDASSMHERLAVDLLGENSCV